MEVRQLTDKEIEQWEEFVACANNGTIFHQLKFLSYHPPERFHHHHCLIKEKNTILAAFPSVIHGTTIISHRGASYGGFVVKKGLGIQKIFLMIEQLTKYFREKGHTRITLTQTPLIYYSEPHQYVDFALLKHGYTYQKREVTAVISLDATDPLGSFHADARRSIKKALREGVHIEITDDYKSFYNILKNNLGMRHNVSPTHTLEELHRLKELYPDDIILFGAYLKKKMIGGIVIFNTNSKVILAFYISHNDTYQSYRPVNLLFHEIILWGKKKGFRYLDLGTFTLNMDPNWGLGRFKENHNARGFLRDTYGIDL